MCDMTHSYMRNGTHSYVWHDSFICVIRRICMSDMTHSHVRHDSFIRVTWLIHMCCTTHLYTWRDSFICVTRLIHTCGMMHSYEQRLQCFQRCSCNAIAVDTYLWTPVIMEAGRKFSFEILRHENPILSWNFCRFCLLFAVSGDF